MKEQLLELAGKWREKAERIELMFRRECPGQAEIAEAAIKTCAEELEVLVATKCGVGSAECGVGGS